MDKAVIKHRVQQVAHELSTLLEESLGDLGDKASESDRLLGTKLAATHDQVEDHLADFRNEMRSLVDGRMADSRAAADQAADERRAALEARLEGFRLELQAMISEERERARQETTDAIAAAVRQVTDELVRLVNSRVGNR